MSAVPPAIPHVTESAATRSLTHCLGCGTSLPPYRGGRARKWCSNRCTKRGPNWNRIPETDRPYSQDRCCSVEDCNRKHYGRGYCQMHLARLRRFGDPLIARGPRPSAEQRFWAKVNKDGPIPLHAPHLGACWIWTGSPINSGYGNFYSERRTFVLAHRFAYELLVGPVPEGLTIDHLCRVPLCVNPAHLEPVTQAENNRRAAEANRRDHCPHGHEYTPENSYIAPRGDRRCRECDRIHSRARYHARMATR